MNKLTPHQQSALNYHQHISLTANAGSGKTFVLAKRFVEIALKEKIPLSKIVAITFTDKAASELYKKISKHIEELLNNSESQDVIRQLENLRRQLISSNISTIHSFCLNILREFPVEAELDANFIPIDEKLSSELVELSVDKIIKDSLGNEDIERMKRLIRMFSSKGTLAGELESLVKNFTKIFLIEKKIYSRPFEEITNYYNNIISKYFEKLIGGRINEIKHFLELINKTVLEDKPANGAALQAASIVKMLNPNLNIRELSECLQALKNIICTKTGTIRVMGYLKKEIRLRVEVECKEVELVFKQLEMFFPTENEKEILQELSLFGMEMLYFFRKALSIYEELKSGNGYLDYEDILYKTYNILKNNNVREFLAEKYIYLMIDEYQDTNEIQYNIFLPLLDNLKKGNLFVVGDEKQSIYMFRDAELEVFQRTKGDITSVSGNTSLLKLPDSFRMKPELCLFTNILFRNLFNNPDTLFNEVEHSDLICARDEKEHGGIEILFNNIENNGDSGESDLIAKRILNIIKGGGENYGWGNIAILCRKRKYFTELEKKFTEYKIPFVIMGGKEFYQRQSIYDIYNYFSFLLEPGNDAALTGVLRSPFFDFTDNDIYLLSISEGRTFWQKTESFKDKNPKWNQAYGILKENILLSRDIDFSTLLRKILRESSFISDLSARTDGVQETANIEKLVSLTTSFMRDGYSTLYDYVNFLKESIEEKEDEPQAPVSEESDAVRIMTLHQAKGLEFPVVILYKCNEVNKKSSVKTKSVTADKTFGLLTKIPQRDNYYDSYQSSTINDISNFIILKKEIAESKRLFYVGITRAKELLIISFESNNEIKISPGSFIQMIETGLGADFAKAIIEIEGDLTFLLDQGGSYQNLVRRMKIEIPIIKEIPALYSVSAEPIITAGKVLKINPLKNNIEGEIISATRFSVFTECPLKYFYQYELGFSFTDRWVALNENNIKDEKGELSGTLKGRIMHKLLEGETSRENLIRELNYLLTKENIPEDNKIVLRDEILIDLNKYYLSAVYAEIISESNYKNEYEIYIKKKEFYLYGRIDKIIFYPNKIKIVDYKTDNLSIGKTKMRTEQYLSQLKFYSYIINQFFANIRKFELQIIFIKNPGIEVRYEVNESDLLMVEEKIVQMTDSLKSGNYSQVKESCKECDYSMNNIRCIKEK